MINFDKVIELSDLTINDCIDLYSNGYNIVLNDGVVVDLERED